MDHHHDFRLAPEGFSIASFLIGSVAQVFRMPEHVQAQSSGDFHGFILRGVVHQDDFIHDSLGDVSDRGLQGFFGVVGRKYRDDPSAHLDVRHIFRMVARPFTASFQLIFFPSWRLRAM